MTARSVLNSEDDERHLLKGGGRVCPSRNEMLQAGQCVPRYGPKPDGVTPSPKIDNAGKAIGALTDAAGKLASK